MSWDEDGVRLISFSSALASTVIRAPFDRLELVHVREEALAAAVGEDVAAEAVGDALHGKGAFVSVAEAAVVLALRVEQHGRDRRHVH